MKKCVLAIGLMVAFIGAVFAVGSRQQEPQPWAHKLFGASENLVHDFGVVPHGMQLHHDFTLTNIYPVPLEISNIRIAMSPATASINKHLVQPGEKAKLSVQVDASRFHGHKQIMIAVTINSTSLQFASSAQLQLIANRACY